MASRIQILPPIVAERIAAGEMIERPSSVVKELVENALDAKATEIIVRLEDGGKTLIEITDNGHGMSPEELEICIERHATSKLHSLDDLEEIATLGFRGEAMPSIAAVSDLTLTSRIEGQDAAYQLQVGDLAGRLLARPKVQRVTFGQFIDSNHGTQIRVQGLFSQIPARLKFLKSQAAEVAQVREWLEKLALAYPHVAFQLISEGGSEGGRSASSSKNRKTLLNLRPEDEMSRVRSILSDGDEYPIFLRSNQNDGFRDIGLKMRVYWVQGLSSGNSRKLIQIVNSRAIRDRVLLQATLSPFRQTLLPGQYPAVAVFIEVPPAAIDVNVHPTKAEIRFLDSRKIFQTLESLIKSLIQTRGAPAIVPESSSSKLFEEKSIDPALTPWTAAEPIQQVPFKVPSSLSTNFGGFPSFERENKPTTNDTPNEKAQEKKFEALSSREFFQAPLIKSIQEEPRNQDNTEPRSPLLPFEEPKTQNSLLSGARFVGSFFETYLVFEKTGSSISNQPQSQKQELIFIDQHAAHERIRYEALQKRFLKLRPSDQDPTSDLKNSENHAVHFPSQSLLLPESIRFQTEHRDQIQELIPSLAQIGFEAELFGEDVLLFRSVPAEWGQVELKSRLRNLLDRLLTPVDSSETSKLENPSQSPAALPSSLIDETLFEALASEACHSAIRAGDSLNAEEVSSLVAQLFQCEHPWNCPHGRPTVVKISRGKLEEWFQRKI